MYELLRKLFQLCVTIEEQLGGEWHVFFEIEHTIPADAKTNIIKPVKNALIFKAVNKTHKVMVGFPVPLENLNNDTWNRLMVYGMAFCDKIRKKDLG